MTLAEKVKNNTTQLLNSFQTLNEEQLFFKPSEKVWSVIENIEHIFLVDVGIAKVLATPAQQVSSENKNTELFSDERLNSMLVNRSFKAPAPDFVYPKGRFKNREEAAQNITIIIDKIIHHLNTNNVEQETHTVKHMVLGEMTKTDWIHFLVHHTQRHILQLEEVKKMF